MNLHVGQSIAADVEISNLMSVTSCLLSPANNMPSMGIIQDSLLGAYKLTSPNTFLERPMVFDMLFETFGDSFDCRALLPHPTIMTAAASSCRWSGIDLVSLLLPCDFNLQLPTVRIQRGCIVSGRLCKKSLGRVEGGIIHRLALHYSNERAAKFMTEIQRMSNFYLNQSSFSTGIGDCFIDRAPMQRINETLSSVVQRATTPYVDEKVLNQTLNQARDVVAKIAIDSLDPETHGMLSMAMAGSKGSNINIAQITTAVGQQNVNGQRLNPTKEQGRTLSHFSRCDYDPCTRGFCRNSYLKGLTPVEFFAHMQAGREGLIDTAIKTSDTGYLQRKLTKATENIGVKYDLTVRDHRNRVIQFRYGEDGFDATRLIRVHPGVGDCGALLRKSLYCSPVDFPYLLCQLPKSASPYPSASRDCRVWERMREVVEHVSTNPDNMVLGQLCRSYMHESYFTFVSDEWVLWYCDTIVEKYERNAAQPGEMVGVLAAQSISERATQLTLNTFHFTGIAAKNVTLGLPRLNELFAASKKIKTPNVTFMSSPDSRGRHLNLEPITTLGNVLTCISLEYAFPRRLWTERYAAIFWSAPEDAAVLSEKNWVVLSVSKDTSAALWDRILERLRASFSDVLCIPTHPSDTSEHPSVVLHFAERGQALYEPDLWHTMETTLRGLPLCGILPRGASYSCDRDGLYTLSNITLTRELLELLVKSFSELGDDEAGLSAMARSVSSNNAHDVLNMFGIEAARNCLLNELTYVLKFDGTYINHRHPMLLVDCMTADGAINPMNRSGIKKTASALSFASFEMATASLCEAAVSNTRDELRGVAERLVVGELANVGTQADLSLFLDEEMLVKHSIDLVSEARERAVLDDSELPIMHDLDTFSLNFMGTPNIGTSPASSCLYSPDQDCFDSSQFSPSPLAAAPLTALSPEVQYSHSIYVPASPLCAPIDEHESSDMKLGDAITTLFG